MTFDPTSHDDEELDPESASSTDQREDTEGSENSAAALENSEEFQEKASSAARKLEPIVLAHVTGAKYQPVKPRVIAKQLKLPSEQHQALKLAIKRC